MKLYRVTVSDYGSYGPRGMTHAGTGLTTWAFTDKAQAVRRYNTELKAAEKQNRSAVLRLQILTTPKVMTTELWIHAIVDEVIPYTIDKTIRRNKVEPARMVA